MYVVNVWGSAKKQSKQTKIGNLWKFFLAIYMCFAVLKGFTQLVTALHKVEGGGDSHTPHQWLGGVLYDLIGRQEKKIASDAS